MSMAGGCVKAYGPFVAQLYVQVSYGVMFLITRVALTTGLTHYSYVMYRQIVATCAICPIAFFIDRDQRRNLKLKNLGQIFLLSLIGVTIGQNTYYAGLSYTSTFLATTMNNLNPAITFLLAYLLRMEEVDLRSRKSKVKILGTALCVGGAIVMTFAKGPALNQSAGDLKLLDRKWILGALLLATSACSWSVFLIYQAVIREDYTCQLSMTALVCLASTVQCLAVGISLQKPADWRLNWDLQLLTIVYSGIFCSGLGVYAQMWCVKERGPVFTTAFNPLSTVLVAILEPLLLHVPLHWGSVVGMVLVVGGLYCVLWGKASNGKAGGIDTVKQSIDIETDPGSEQPLLTEQRQEATR